MHPQALAHHQNGLEFHQAGDLLPAVREYQRALAIDPNLELTRSNLAALYLRLGEHEKAAAQYLKLVELNPLNPKAYFNLGGLYSSLGQWPQAIEQLEKLLTLEPDHAPGLLNLGWLYHRQGNLEPAIAAIERADRLDPDNPKIELELGQLFLDSERKEEARLAFTMAVEHDPFSPAPRLALAECAWLDGMAREALRYAREVLEIDPREPRARELCAWCYRMFADQAKETNKIEEYAENLEGLAFLSESGEVFEKGEIFEILEELKRLYLHLGDLFKLIRVLERLVERKPEPPNLFLLGETLLKCGQRERSKKVFRSLAEGDHPLAALNRLFRLAKEDRESTAEIAAAIVSIDPCHPDALLSLAEDAFKRGDLEKTADWVEAILAVEANPRALELHTLAYRALAKASEAVAPPEAIRCWGEVLRLKADDTEALGRLGRLFAETGRDAEAVKVLKRLLSISPRDTEIAFLLALLYRRMGVEEGAKAILQAIIARFPHVPTAVALADGDPPNARAHLAKALDWEPRSPLALVALGRLELKEGQLVKAWAQAQLAIEIERSPATVSLAKDCLKRLSFEAALKDNLTLALQLSGRLIELDPLDPASLRLQGRLCRRKGVTAKSAEAFAAILKIDPADMGAIHGLYSAYQRMNLNTQAKGVLHASLKRKKRPRILILLIQACQEEGNPFGVLEYSEELLELRPGHLAATRFAVYCCRSMAMKALEKKDLPISAYYWERLLSFQPDDLEAVKYLATIYLRSKDYRQALPVFEKLHALDPENFSALVNLAWLNQQGGHPDEAIARYHEALEHQPGDTKLMLILGQLCRQQGRIEEAREVFRARLLLDPNHLPTHVGLAEIAWNRGELSECLLHAREILARSPKDKEGRALGISCLRELVRTAPTARERAKLCEDLLELQPNDLFVLEATGQAQIEAKNLPKAVAAYERLVLANPRSRRSLFLLGETLAAAGQVERAREVLEALDRAEPHLAALETLTGLYRGEAAIPLIKRLLLFVPEHVPAQRRLARLLPPLEALPVLEKLRLALPEERELRDETIAAFEDLARSSREKVEEEGYLRELLKIVPEHLGALRRLSVILPNQAAEDFLLRLIELDPDDRSIARLARYRLKKGRREEAYPLFERIADRDQAAAIALAEIDRQNGDFLQAVFHYRQALENEGKEESREEIFFALGRTLLEGESLEQAGAVFRDLLQKKPDRLSYRLALAEVAVKEGDFSVALLHSRECLVLAPEGKEGRAWAIQALENLAGRAKSPSERSELIEELLLLRNDPAWLERLGEAYQEAFEPFKAIEAFERLERLLPLPRTRFLLGEALRKAGEEERALLVFSSLARANHFAAQEALVELKKGEDALPDIFLLLALVPEHFPALQRLARLLSPSEALPVFEQLLALSPENAEVLEGCALVYEELAAQAVSPEEAERLLRDSLRRKPDHRRVIHQLVRLLLERQELGEAESLLNRLLPREADDESSYLLALCWQGTGRRREAYDLLGEIDPRYPGVALALARLAEEEHDFLEAERRYLRALALAPSDKAIRRSIAKSYLEQGRHREALNILDFDPREKNIEILLLRSEALRQVARQEEEEGRWLELLALLPDDGEAHQKLGALLYHQERYGEALDHLDCEEQPFLAAEALSKMGRAEEAKNIYQRILEKEPARSDVKFMLAEIAIDQGDDTLPKLPRALDEKEKEIALRCFRKLAKRVARPRRYWHRVLDLAPDDIEAMRALASIYLQSGNHSEAQELLERLNDRVGGADIRFLLAQADWGLELFDQARQLLVSNRSHVPSLLLLAGILEETDEEDAIFRYKKVLALEPENTTARAALGRMAYDDERWEEAVSYLEGVPRSEATRIECHRQLASLEKDDAESHWRSLLALAPRDRDARRNLGDLLHKKGRFEEGLIYLDPNRQALAVIDCYRSLGLVEEALGACEAAIAKNPGDKTIPLVLSEIAYGEGEPQWALEMAERALALDRNDQRAKTLALKYMEDVVNHARQEGDLTNAVRTLERLRSLAPDRRILRHLGNTYSELGLYEKALSCFNALLQIDPNDRDIAFLVGETLLKRGEKKSAKNVFQGIIEHNPHHLPAQLALADLCWQAGDDRQAIEHLEKVLSRKPDHRDAADLANRCYRELAHQAIAAGNPKEAISYWEKVSRLFADDAEALFELGRLYHEIGNPAKAVKKLQRITDGGLDEETTFLLANCLLATGKKGEGKELLEKIAFSHFGAAFALAELARGDASEEEFRLKELLRLQPDLQDSQLRLAALLLEMERPGDALSLVKGMMGVPRAVEIFLMSCRALGRSGEMAAWHSLLEILPQDFEALLAITDFHLDRGEDREAVDMLERLCEVQDDPLSRQARGECLLRMRNYAGAIESFQKGLLLVQNHLPCKFGLARAHWEMGNLSEAWRFLAEVLERRPNYQEAVELGLDCLERLYAEALLLEEFEAAAFFLEKQQLIKPETLSLSRLAEAYRMAGNHPKAIRAYEKLVEENPADLEASFGFGQALFGAGKLENAKRELERLLVLKPDQLPVLSLLARIALRLSLVEDAKDFHIQILELDRDNPESRLALGEIAFEEGSVGEALAYVSAVFEKNPDHPIAKSLSLACHRKLAAEAERSGDFSLALVFRRTILEFNPADPRAQKKLAQDLDAAGRREEAVEAYRRLLEACPYDHEASLVLAELLLESEPRLAREIIQGIVATTPRHAGAFLRLAKLELGLGNPEEARLLIHRLLATTSLCRASKGILLSSCRQLARLGGPRGIELWEEILEVLPKDREALFNLGSILAEDTPLEAIPLLERRVGLSPSSTEAMDLLVGCYLDAQRPEEAIPILERRSKLPPWDPEVLILLADCYLDALCIEKAEKVLAEVLEKDPASVGAQLMLSRSANLRGDEGEAARFLAIAEAADPGDIASLVALGKAALERNDFQGALRRFEKTLSLDREHSTAHRLAIETYRILARLDGKEEEILSYWERLLELVPGDPEAMAELARIFLSRGDERGEELCRRCLEVCVDSDLTFLLATELKKQGREEEAEEWLQRILGWDEAFLPALLELADRRWREGDLEAGRAFFDRVIEADPFNVQAHLSLSEMALQADDLGIALLEIERVMDFAPELDNAKILAIQIASRLVGVSRQSGDLRGEIGHLKRIIEFDPAELDARYRLAEIFWESERFSEAEELCREMIELGEEKPLVFFQWGQTLERLGREQEAVIAYDHVLTGDPQHIPSLLRLADFSWRSQDLDRAWELIETLLSVDPENERGLELRSSIAHELGAVAFRLNNFSDAIAWWQVCLAFSSNDLPLLRQVAQAYLGSGDIASASLLYQQLLERDPDDLDTLFLLADLFRRQGDLNRSAKIFEQILQREPRHVESLVSLARVSKEQGDPKETMSRAFRALDVDPNQTDALEVLVWSHQQLFEVKAAIEVYLQITQLKPQDPEPQHRLAILYRDTGQYDLARKAMTAAIYHCPKDPHYFNTLGTVYSLQGLFDEASASFNYALQLDPEFGEAYANFGFALMQAGEKNKARPYLERANELLEEDSELALSIKCMLDLF